MTPLFVDAATCSQMIQYYSTELGDTAGCQDWDYACALRLTTLLIGAKNIAIAPGPDRARGASQAYAIMTRELMTLGVVAQHDPSQMSQNKAARVTEAWCTKNRPLIEKSHDALKRDPNFPKWLGWNARHSFEDHALRLGGLFSKAHVPLLADLLGASREEMERLRNSTTKESFLMEVRNGNVYGNSEFATILEAYVLSAEIRSVYHDVIARAERWQVCHHPLRRYILDGFAPSEVEAPVDTSISLPLAKLVLANGWAEHNLEQRLVCWAESVRTIRDAVTAQKVFFNEYALEQDAEREAEEIAERLKLRNYSKRTGRVVTYALEMLASSAVAVSLKFALSQFNPGLDFDVKTVVGVSGGIYTGLKALTAAGEKLDNHLEEVYPTVTRRFQKYRLKLAELAAEPAGRLR